MGFMGCLRLIPGRKGMCGQVLLAHWNHLSKGLEGQSYPVWPSPAQKEQEAFLSLRALRRQSKWPIWWHTVHLTSAKSAALTPRAAMASWGIKTLGSSMLTSHW